jgi:hypothetical protein
MKYMLLLLIVLLVSCSGSYDSKETKDAETLAILLDMSVSDIFADLDKAAAIWKSMPEEIRDTKNPVKNQYDLKIDTGKYAKHLSEIQKDIEKLASGNIPSELEEVIKKLYEIYSLACNKLNDQNANYSKIIEFINKTKPEYKSIRDELTEIQENISKK